MIEFEFHVKFMYMKLNLDSFNIERIAYWKIKFVAFGYTDEMWNEVCLTLILFLNESYVFLC